MESQIEQAKRMTAIEIVVGNHHFTDPEAVTIAMDKVFRGAIENMERILAMTQPSKRWYEFWK